jgi:hypothetical protein
MAFEDYHASRTTLDRLETTFKNGYLSVLKIIADSPNFFNGKITGEELFNEFVAQPIKEIKDLEKKKNNHENDDIENKDLPISKKYRINMSKCHALIHLKRELRQCQSNQLPDDDFCCHHSKLDTLPYGRITV